MRLQGDAPARHVIQKHWAKPIHGMKLQFHFTRLNNESLTVMRLVDCFVEPQDTAEFHLQVKYPSRAVQLKIEAEDKDHRGSSSINGPFPID